MARRRGAVRGRWAVAAAWLAVWHPILGHGEKVHGDGKQYYCYARAFVVNGDFRLHREDAAPTEPRSAYLQEAYLADATINGGRIYSQYSVGCALLWLPGVALVHAGLAGGHVAGLAGLPPADGFSKPYRLAAAVTTALLGLAGLLLAYDLALGVAGPVAATWGVVAGLFATPLYNYLSYETSMSEGPSFFAVTLVIWLWRRIRAGKGSWGWWGAAIGLATIIRYTQAPLVLLPAWEWLRGKRGRPWAALGGFLVPCGIQAVVWKASFGAWSPPPYNAGIATWWKFNPVMLLWSARHGLFALHPVWWAGLAGCVGLVWPGRGSRDQEPRAVAAGLLAAFAVLLYINQLPFDFWAGHSFGARRFVPVALLVVVGTAYLVGRAARRWRHGLAGAAALIVVLSALSFEALADYRALGDRRDLPSPQGARLLPAAVYRVTGWPASWPANLWWAYRTGTTPDRFDYLLDL